MKKVIQIQILAMLFAVSGVYAQGSLTGVVNDAQSGEPLPGANVFIEELELGASTDIDGQYAVTNIPLGTYDVRVTFLGYREINEEVTITTGENIQNFELQPDFLGLDEMIVTGYGEQRRDQLSTSISRVSADEISDVSAGSPDALLQGAAAGVQVVRQSGAPGGGVRVDIRGQSSITAGNEPLYVIDGVPITSGDFSNINVGNQGLNALSNLNPEDIESMEILKDASAAAIYGARGANGVVLITTKRGAAGPTQFEAGYRVGVREFTNEMDMMGGPEYIEAIVEGAWLDYQALGLPLQWEGSTYDSRLEDVREWSPAVFGAPFEAALGMPHVSNHLDDPSGAPTTDWQDEVFETGRTQNFYFNASGGDDVTRFYVGATYFDERGIMKNSGFERLSGRLNLDHAISDRSNLTANASYQRSESNRLENDNNIYGVLTNAVLSSPTAPIFLEDGLTYNPSVSSFSNPVAASEVVNDALDTRFTGSVELDYELVDNLVVSGKMGIDRFDLQENQFAQGFTNQGSPLGTAFSSIRLNQTWLAELQARYSNVFDDVHFLDAVAVVSYQENQNEYTASDGDNFASNDLQTVNTAAVTSGYSFGTAYGLESYTTRVNYAYDNRYVLSGSARVDGSSRFGDDNQYGVFPAGSFAWRIANEEFMSGFDVLEELKLRLSVGITGNQDIGNFSHLPLFGVNSYGGFPGLEPSQLANPDLKWEETTQYNVGLDVTLFDDRISATIDAYMSETDNLLLSRPVPATSGFTTFTNNIGSLENKGIEFSLRTVNVQTPDFSWVTNFNISRNLNEVTALHRDEPFSSGFANRVQVGEPLGAFYGYKTDGVWASQEEIDNSGIDFASSNTDPAPGDIRFVDVNGDGVITADDQTILGDANPDFQGGLRNTFSYRGFELMAFLQFSYGNDIFNNSRAFYGFPGFIPGWGVFADAEDRWTPDNPDGDAFVQRASLLDLDNASRDSDFWMEDGSYLRLKTLRLGYTFTGGMLEQYSLRSARIYVIGQNLLTFTDYTGLDPEMNTFDRSNTAFGTDFFSYPQSRSIEVGIDLGF